MSNSANFLPSSIKLLRNPEDLKRQVRAELCRRSLAEFTRQAWSVLEPDTPLVWGWCLDAISLHLESISRGQIRKLLINVPPGHMKSLMTAVMWPAWVWTWRPGWRLFSASYAANLALRDSVKTRQLIESDWYQSTFQPSWGFQEDQNTKSFYRNSAGGERFATGVGGSTTGFRGDVVLVDDPLNAMDALSETSREHAWEWWRMAAASRLNSLETGAHVLMGQRLHHEDVFAHLIESGKYEHLRLPSEFELDERCATSIWSDPRTTEGELLFPDRFPRDVIDEAKRELGPSHYEAQHQQRPTPKSGGYFDPSWFRRVANAPKDVRLRVRAWDLAATDDGGDYTAGVKMSMTKAPKRWCVEHVIRFRKGPAERNETIKQVTEADGKETKVYFEQEPGSAGVFQVDQLRRELAGFSVSSDRPTGDKEVRADPFASQVKGGNVDIVEGPWIEDFLRELSQFPKGKNDDQVDAASAAFQFLASKRFVEVS